MKNNNSKFQGFQNEVLNRSQQKAIKGGEDSTSATPVTPIDPNDPSKGTGGNGNN